MKQIVVKFENLEKFLEAFGFESGVINMIINWDGNLNEKFQRLMRHFKGPKLKESIEKIKEIVEKEEKVDLKELMTLIDELKVILKINEMKEKGPGEVISETMTPQSVP